MLNEHLKKLDCKRFPLCFTLAGNKCEYIHITGNKKRVKLSSADTTIKIVENPAKGSKQIVMITSRVHPGESNSSWMLKGLIDMLFHPQN